MEHAEAEAIYDPGREFDTVFASEGIAVVRTPVRAPKATAERFVRSARTVCLDWLLILHRRHLEQVLRIFVHHYNSHWPYRLLDLAPPNPMLPRLRQVSSAAPARVERRDRLGGLLHEYSLAA